MKYELLKRTAIALFVGGVISTYASADTKLDDALATIKTAIETNKAGLESKADKALVDELDEDVGNLEDKVSGIVATAANKEDLGKLNDAVETLRDDVNNNTDTLSQNSDDIAANKEAIEANKAAIETNKAALESKADKALADELDKDVGELEDKVSGIIATAANKEDLGKLNDAVETLRDDVNSNTDILSQNSEDIAANKEAIEANRSDIDANAVAIDKLRETQTYKDLSKVETLVKDKANKSEVEKNASRIADTRNKQALQNARLDNHGKRIEENKAEIAKKANQTDVDANKAEIAKKADKTELANKADKNNVYSKSDADQLFALKADNSVVSAQAVEINKLRTDVNAHTKRLDHLDNRVNKLDKDLKRGLAAQAALTGLFQPYTVGKANFTAAVGGYKSQTAVAIGTGYRYNQNVATKAGVAFTQGGGVTYNAGVNFEW